MKNRVITVSILFSLFALMAGVSADAQEDRLKVTIPFDFTAGNKILPAGEYTIERGMSNQPDLLLIRGTDNRKVLFLNADETMTINTPTETDLVFQKIGDRYFLYRIWMAGEDVGREIPKSRAERELERNMSSTDVSMVTVRTN